MDVRDGNPKAIFDWFFNSNQGTDHMAQFLLIFYGVSQEMAT